MSTTTAGLKNCCQRFCPSCNDVISIRRHVCNCGYSFIDAKLKAEQEKVARQEKMGFSHNTGQEQFVPTRNLTKRKRLGKKNLELKYRKTMQEMEEEIAKLQAAYDARNKDKKPQTEILQYSGSSCGRKSRALGTPSNPFPVNHKVVESAEPAVEVVPEPIDGQRKRFQRRCPSCRDIINVRRHVCNCGYSFIDARRKAEKEKEAHHEEIGKRATNYKTLSRSLTAIKKHTAKLRGGGYQIAVVYFKVRSQRTIKSILPGSGLSKEGEQNLIKYFYLSHTQNKEVNAMSAQQNDVNEDDSAASAEENLVVNCPKQEEEDNSLKMNKKKVKRKCSRRSNDAISHPVAASCIPDQTFPKYDVNNLPTPGSLDLENFASSSSKLDQAVNCILDQTLLKVIGTAFPIQDH
ncbi:uncharacterized protein [Procambarus clarkii]|uniref:uncharacterized protein n=1 Tax=Procambarus clarkii TaxID=6728 RepID=UPI001E6765F5|nr:uncharacterized protein LOC123755488 [Procambarus clarkii]